MTEELAQIVVADCNGTPVVEVSGDVDISNAGVLSAILSSVPAAPVVAIDLSNVAFIDSTGLNAIARFGRQQLDSGGALYLVVTGSAVRKVLEITGLHKHFNVVKSLDDLP